MAFANTLARLSTGARASWLIFVVWILLFLGVGSTAREFSQVQRNDLSALTPHDAESTRVRELLASMSQGRRADLPALVVYVHEGGLTPADRAKINQDLLRLTSLRPGDDIQPASESTDGWAMMLIVPLTGADTNTAYDAVKRIRAVVSRDPPAGLDVKVTGPAAAIVDSADSFLNVDSKLLFTTVIVVAILLVFIYRSPLLWCLPFVAVLCAIAIAQGAVTLLAKHSGLVVNGLSAGILTVLVFGVGTDYALLLIARYREELLRYPHPHVAMTVALARAVPPIAASAAIVSVSLLCLLAAQMNTNRSLGPVEAVGIVCAFLAMTTLLPVLLLLGGRWVFWPRIPRSNMRPVAENTPFARIANRIARGPRITWLVTLILLGALTAGLGSVKTKIPGDLIFTVAPESIVGQQLIGQHFPSGAAEPVDIVASATAEQAVMAAVSATQGVARVSATTLGAGFVEIQAFLADPPESAAAARTVMRLRATTHRIPGANALVGGITAQELDTAIANEHDRNLIIPAALVVVLVALVVLLRSVITPLLISASVVASFLASLGATWLAFRHLFGFPALDDLSILLGFVFLVALGVDYSVFLMTRAREDVARLGDHRAGMLHGLAATGGVITGAGIVLAATFTLLAVFPMVWTVELGLLVAFGVLLDTFVVRLILVPALAIDIGPATWWPSRVQAVRGMPRSGGRSVGQQAEELF